LSLLREFFSPFNNFPKEIVPVWFLFFITFFPKGNGPPVGWEPTMGKGIFWGLLWFPPLFRRPFFPFFPTVRQIFLFKFFYLPIVQHSFRSWFFPERVAFMCRKPKKKKPQQPFFPSQRRGIPQVFFPAYFGWCSPFFSVIIFGTSASPLIFLSFLLALNHMSNFSFPSPLFFGFKKFFLHSLALHEVVVFSRYFFFGCLPFFFFSQYLSFPPFFW